ncbi:hypothetical protein LXL04_026067 [Taraxacum kok-saghyz]
MLRKMVACFTHLKELDLSQSALRSFYLEVNDSYLFVIVSRFTAIRLLKIQIVKVTSGANKRPKHLKLVAERKTTKKKKRWRELTRTTPLTEELHSIYTAPQQNYEPDLHHLLKNSSQFTRPAAKLGNGSASIHADNFFIITAINTSKTKYLPPTPARPKINTSSKEISIFRATEPPPTENHKTADTVAREDNHLPAIEEEEQWKQVRRKKNRIEDHAHTAKTATSFFFQNFPENINKDSLRQIFQTYGTVVDVFIPAKIDISNRKFGFVRFIRVNNPTKFLSKLQNIWIGSYKVRISIAKYQRPVNSADRRGITTATPHLTPYPSKTPQTPQQTAHTSKIRMFSEANSLDNMQDSLVGVTEDFQALMNIPNFREVEGCPDIDMRYLGGLKMILRFASRSEKTRFLEEADHIWKRWFNELYPWSMKENFNERIASILIYGIPQQAWCEEAFTAIASSCGKVIIPEECASDNPNLAFGKVGILTTHPGLVSQTIVVTIDNQQYNITAIEDTLESTRLSPVVASNDRVASPEWMGWGNWSSTGDSIIFSDEENDRRSASDPGDSSSTPTRTPKKFPATPMPVSDTRELHGKTKGLSDSGSPQNSYNNHQHETCAPQNQGNRNPKNNYNTQSTPVANISPSQVTPSRVPQTPPVDQSFTPPFLSTGAQAQNKTHSPNRRAQEDATRSNWLNDQDPNHTHTHTRNHTHNHTHTQNQTHPTHSHPLNQPLSSDQPGSRFSKHIDLNTAPVNSTEIPQIRSHPETSTNPHQPASLAESMHTESNTDIEISQTIKVGERIGFNVTGYEDQKQSNNFGTTGNENNGIQRSSKRAVWGNNNVQCEVRDPCGLSGGIATLWCPNKFTLTESKSELGSNQRHMERDEVRFPSERLGSTFCPSTARYFNNFIASSGLIDVQLGGRKYTYATPDGSKHSRIDRCLITYNTSLALPNLRVTVLPRLHSDHCPILISAKGVDFDPRPFRFFNSWLLESSLDEVVKAGWTVDLSSGYFSSLSPLAIVAGKLKHTKEKIKQWQIHEKEQEHKMTKDLTDKMNDLDLKAEETPLSAEEINTRKNLHHRLMELESKRIQDIRQKARCKWALEGDENSGFFHGLINNNYQKQTLTGLNINVIWTVDPKEIKAEILRHFSGKFKEPTQNRPEFHSSLLKQLTPQDSSKIEDPITYDEVKAAAWACGGERAPGPDGFSFEFIRKQWDKIGDDIFQAVKDFEKNGQIPQGCNSSFVVLVPKISDPVTLDNYRPINLIGCC